MSEDETDDELLICPVTCQPCWTEENEFCEDYGCARLAGIDVDRDSAMLYGGERVLRGLRLRSTGGHRRGSRHHLRRGRRDKMTDQRPTPESLRAIVADAEAFNGKVMREWDAVRAATIGEVKRGVSSDHSRLMFECNILEPLLKTIREAADEIERLLISRVMAR